MASIWAFSAKNRSSEPGICTNGSKYLQSISYFAVILQVVKRKKKDKIKGEETRYTADDDDPESYFFNMGDYDIHFYTFFRIFSFLYALGVCQFFSLNNFESVHVPDTQWLHSLGNRLTGFFKQLLCFSSRQ